MSEAALAPDQLTYHFGGDALARYWSGDRPTPPALLERSPPAYFYIIAVIYYVFGSFAVLPKLANCLVGAATVQLTYNLAFCITASEETSLRAARLCAYFPSLVLWSALNIRDVWIVFLILLVCLRTMKLQEGFRLQHLMIAAAGIYGLTLFRAYILVAIAVPILISFLIRDRPNFARNAILGSLLASIVIFADVGAGKKGQVALPDLETLQQLRRDTGFGGSRYDVNVDISSPTKALAYLPRGVAMFLLAPFPWEVRGFRQVLTLPEMLFFYSLLPSLLRGMRKLLRERLEHSFMVFFIAGSLTLGYSLGQANVGTAYRYRAQVLPIYLVFAAAGVRKAAAAGVPARRRRLRA